MNQTDRVALQAWSAGRGGTQAVHTVSYDDALAFLFFLMTRRPPRSPLFPSSTLFRSVAQESLMPANAVVRARIDARVKEEATDRKSTRLNSSHLGISYAVFCLKK